jgi:type VI secretion system secreted protein VgrG
MGLKQDGRSIAIKTPLGADVLGLRSFSVQEELSHLFHIEAQLSSENGQVNLDDVVGHDVTIRLNLGDKGKRFFHGFVSQMVQEANQSGYAQYRATIVPWLWFLTRTSDCRLWAADQPSQGKTVPQIIEEVFKGHGFSDYKLKLSGNYPKREFCVQYRETDFDFVSRLMEQEGIYYFFEHKEGKHTLVLADSISAHNAYSGYSEIVFHEAENRGPVREVVTVWTMKKEVQPVATALQDFDFKKPKTSLLASTKVSRKYGKAEYEVYDYPGEYLEHGDGQQLADARLAELQTQYETLQGQAHARGLAAGHTFKLKNHPRSDQNREYLITSVALQADGGEFASGGPGGAEFFSCNFTCIDKTQQFRPARVTPKPMVRGPQTAVVVGPAGEEIYTDEHARVKLHFYWNRHDKSDENSSCWVRVSQYWAGKTWGSIHIPRIGQEVVVEFLEGDPDRPIIIGRVYNADQTPPYGLPGNKTQSGIKSRSSKGGSSPNFNEIRFEDKKGSEEVYIHAEKDQNNVVEHDETTKVGHDRSEQVGNDETINITHDRKEKVGNNETIEVVVDRTEKVGNNESIAVGVNRTRNVGSNESVTVGSSRTHTVAVNEAITVGVAQQISVGVDQSISVGAAQQTSVGANQKNSIGKDQTNDVSNDRNSSVGNNDTLQVSKKLSIDAGEEITITTGQASISMKKDGTIAIKGKDISIEGSGEINVKASKNITMKGQKILQN